MRMDKLLNTKLFLLDMDGTLYLGDEVFDGAVDFIDTVKKSGREYIYLTNNSSRAGVDYITRLRKLGFPCEKENVFTSGMATAMYLNSRHKGELVIRRLLMKSSIKPCITFAAALHSLPQTPTGCAPCRQMRSCPTAAASARF